MPIVYQHNINEHTKLALWQIEEPESFFLQRVPLKQEVSHPHKRLQHLAGRYLLPVLFPDFPLEAIRVADTRKPFLENEQYHFSISHCGNYAAAIVSTRQRVGIDIEAITPRILRVQHKFVGPAEGEMLGRETSDVSRLPTIDPRLLTLLWSAKEVIFKWYGTGQLDFREHMRLSGPPAMDEQGFVTMPFTFNREKEIQLTVYGRFMDQLVLSWTGTGNGA
ncbi:MAG TPA: 4'-phosphopantetheinyl transferase superfamily protein [Chitinophagaceae bacterium]|nr:4'-phosphopantetheinyl transferase superfamily protein [Chitinophagaceae bacterium]